MEHMRRRRDFIYSVPESFQSLPRSDTPSELGFPRSGRQLPKVAPVTAVSVAALGYERPKRLTDGSRTPVTGTRAGPGRPAGR